MRKKNYITTAIFLSAFAVILSSCFRRELENEENYINLKKEESLQDNEVLRFKTFRINDDGFLIFGNNNEVSIDAQAILPLYFFIDNGNKQAKIDLTGCIYEYTGNTGELLFRNAMLRSESLKNPLLFDAYFSFLKASGSDTRNDVFYLKLKKIVLSENKVLQLGDRAQQDGITVGFMSEFMYRLVYYRN